MYISMDQPGFKLVGAILIHRGEISVMDIKAMPFFTRPVEIDAVVKALMKKYDVEIYHKKVASWPIPEWEEIIRLKKSVN